MNKKFLSVVLFGALIFMVGAFTSCDDYDDDINGLQKQVDELNSTVDAIKADVVAGAAITGVEQTSGGIKITLSDGKSYDITNGKDGANGSVVTIGDNGNWFIDGKDTGNASQGKPGKDGEPGKDGDGKDGAYFYPNEDGFWYKVENGAESKTDQTWLPAGTVTAVYENGVVSLYNVQGAEGPIVLGFAPISSLVLIPDYVADKGGALPVLNFSPLTTACGDIAPSTQARYRVNPSNATVDQIDIENLEFFYNNPAVTKSAKINPKATFVSLENGILTVEVDVNTAELEDATSDKIDQIMLMVPLKDGGTISSDWAKVASDPISYKDLALMRKPKPEANAQDDMILTKTFELTKAVAKTDPRVVEIAYDGEVDLLEVVKTMIKKGEWADFAIDKPYNLEYAFDLKDEKGNVMKYELGANKTDQQKFINLVGSKVTTRVYDIDGANPASIDRTPIVHVMLKSKDGAVDCNILEGFIKLSIVETKVEPVPPVEIEVDGKVEASCDNFELRVGTQQMNEEFYAKAGVSKEFFHTNYTWAEETGGVGTIVEVADPSDTESYNLLWTVTSDELWTNIGKTITKSGTYTYGGHVIKVTFKATITQPELNLKSLLIDNYWYDNYSYIIHNVAVPVEGATNPAECTFANNINNAFKTTDDKLLDLEAALKDNKGKNLENYSYEYIFDEKDQPVKTVDGITISVSADGKELLAKKGATTETVATINTQAAGTGDILAYNEASELGKYLLNKAPEYMKARIKLIVKNECDKEVILKAFNGKDSFLVHFLRPVNVAGQSAENFVDGVDFGSKGSVLDVKEVVALSDWRNYSKDVKTYNFLPDNENYYAYYGVQAITIDPTNIVPVGLIVDGEDLAKLPSTIEVTQDEVGTANYQFGRLTYRNNGANLKDPFTMKVPVVVEYKWGKVETIVEVAVKPTAATRR